MNWIHKLQIISELTHTTGARLRDCDESWLRAFPWMLYLLTVGRFSPAEIKAYAVHLRPYRRKLPVVISKERSLERLRRLNRVDASRLTEDKHRFYTHCEQIGLPIPEPWFSTQSNDPRFERLRQMRETDLITAFPEHFVVKSRHGAYGEGFVAFASNAGIFSTSNGLIYTPTQLLSWLTDLHTGPMVVQKRIFDHDALSALSRSKTLQCVRLVSYRDARDLIRFPFFILKLVCNNNISDNFHGGLSGNLIAYGDRETGTLTGAVGIHPSGMGLAELSEHPESKTTIAGFKIPFWNEARDLVSMTHASIPDLTTIGWDIGITPNGPVLIEGNAWYDPPLYAPQVLSDEDWLLIFGRRSTAITCASDNSNT